MKELERINKEHETIKPYIDAISGVRIVRRSEIDPIMDSAIVANIEAGVLRQGINDAGEVVVFRKPFEISKRPSYQSYHVGSGIHPSGK